MGSNKRNTKEDSTMALYEIYVGNVGNVYRGTNTELARIQYNECVALSRNGYGRYAGEPVTLMCNDEPSAEYTPPLDLIGDAEKQEPKQSATTYIVVCRDDSYNGIRGEYVLATRRQFNTRIEALVYATGIADSREAIVVECPKGLTYPTQKAGN